MADPTSTPAGSEEGPAASNSTPGLMPAPADYQFPTRKARREAELTGMIPIIVPKKAVAQTRPVEPAASAPAVMHDGGNGSSGAPADVVAAPVTVEILPDVDETQDSDAVVVTVTGEVSAVEVDLEAVPADESVFAPSPVSAVHVTGMPLVPAPGGPVAATPVTTLIVKVPRTPRAGRDLPAAIGVGVGLLVVVLGSLLFYPLGFVIVATAFACVGVWEVNRAVVGRGISAPLTPVMAGALAMPASAYFAGAEGLLFALVASATATVLWRSLDSEPDAARSILAGVFMLTWIPFLLSFVFLMLRGDQGPDLGLTLDLAQINVGVIEVIIMLLLVVANDTFGYLVGVIFGKHPMAPKISPKKSWEGFAGSLGGAMLVAIPTTVFLLDQEWWVGLALAIGLVLAGTGGDFAESMVKRELGVKDMSNLLPGHGGFMDRLDSILFAAPMAYAIYTVLGRL
jgi:phosphatidate cytidylyltransferase